MTLLSRLVAPMKNGANLCSGSRRFMRISLKPKKNVVQSHGEDHMSRYDRYGRIFLGSACAAGIGGLCLYGIRGSRDMSLGERAVMWSPLVRARIRRTFAYFGMGLATTAGAVVALHRTGASLRLMEVMRRRPFLSMLVPLGGMIVTNVVNSSIPYREKGLNVEKFGLLLLCNGIVAGIISPLTVLGGPLLMRAAMMTGGAMGSLALAAMCAPSHEFVNYGGALSLGLGAMCIATLGSAFLPVGGAAAAGFHAFYVYGGLVLFGGLTMYDVQRIVHRAETSSRYDPICASLSIYMDAINIFIRVAMMLAGQKRRR